MAASSSRSRVSVERASILRPVANLFALADPDPGLLDTAEETLRRTGEFAHVWRPAPGWLAAQAPLPDGTEDGEGVRSRGFAFVEGRDRLERGAGLAWLERVSELADHAPHRLAELPGDFCFLRFRPDGTGLAVRSCGGLAPLYLHRRPSGGVVLATLLNYIPRFLAERFRLDPLINATWHDSLIFIDGRTFVEGISILPRATHTELDHGGDPRTATYWDPRPAEGDEIRPSPEHARELRRVLLETLERDLDPGGRNLVSLSGGVDSSSVAALVAGTLGLGLSSWSLIPPDEPQRTHELSYIDPLVSQFRIEPARKVPGTVEFRRRWLAATAGLPFQVMNPLLRELPGLCREQRIGAIVGGEFADEVCGYDQRLVDWTRHTSLLALLAHPHALPFGRRDYLRWAKRRAHDLAGRPLIPFPGSLLPDSIPAWVRPEVEAEYREWLDRRRRAARRDRRPLGELAERVAADSWVDMHWEGTTPLGVRRSLPFFNREVLELAFRCHPRDLLGPGHKRLLRDALRDDVPARYLFRPDEPGADTASRSPAPHVDMPIAVQSLVRSDWTQGVPGDATRYDVSKLLWAAQVAEYLEAPPQRPGSTNV